MTWWVYKCNNTQHANQVVHGDWSVLFGQKQSMEWGSTERVPDLTRLSSGDMIIATQTERNELVGVAKVVRLQRRKQWKDVYLRPLKRIGVKVKPLKETNARIARIPALQPGRIQTIYDITARDAALLLKAAGYDSTGLDDRSVPPSGDQKEKQFIEGEKQVAEAIRRGRSAGLRAEAKRQHGTKCSVCGFDFGEFYGPRAADYIQVHHRTPLATTTRRHKSTIDDVDVVCANCHVVLHLNPPIEVHELRATLRRKHRSRG